MSDMGRTIDFHLGRTASEPDGGSMPNFARPATVSPREHAFHLIRRKKEIEEETQVYIDLLKTASILPDSQLLFDISQHGADFQTTLVDSEGFPRGDIDVAAIRTARSRIVRLRNDLSALNAAMATALEETLPAESEKETTVDAPSHPTLLPFAVVNSVAAGSPAEHAGLLKSDSILRFGGITSETTDCLPAVAALVGRSEDTVIPLVVQREGTTQLLALTPRAWSGRGMLGCHILPWPS